MRVGQRVRVRGDLKAENRYPGVVPPMRKLCGKVATITERWSECGGNYLDIDKSKYVWTDWMLVKL